GGTAKAQPDVCVGGLLSFLVGWCRRAGKKPADTAGSDHRRGTGLFNKLFTPFPCPTIRPHWGASFAQISRCIWNRHAEGAPKMNRPVTLQEILQAKITSLEEMAGQLKGLSKLKRNIVDDAENPPEHPERFRQKAMEHKRDAFAALAAKYILEEVVLAARTKAEQIALMRHYVLEFGQEMRRKAKLSNSLADDDPQKWEVDEDGFQASFVVYTLNGILSDVAPEPPHCLSPPSTAHPTLAAPLGQVLSSMCTLNSVSSYPPR